MSHYLVISAIGEDRQGLVAELTEVIVNTGCNIEDSRMTILGGEFAMLIMISGEWNNVAKLEDSLPSQQEKLGILINSKRTEKRELTNKQIPYSVEVVSLDHPGIVQKIAGFFSTKQINIHDMYTVSQRAPHTGSPMFCVNMTIEIPAATHISTLREEFIEFCDELNLDAMMEPVKV